jgi:HEAT repeat protein
MDRDPKVRWKAQSTLQRIAPDVVPDLAECLKDTDADIRREAASALGRVGSDAMKAVPALAIALNDREAMVRRQAAIALELMLADIVPKVKKSPGKVLILWASETAVKAWLGHRW